MNKKRPLERPRTRWVVDVIARDIKNTEGEVIFWRRIWQREVERFCDGIDGTRWANKLRKKKEKKKSFIKSHRENLKFFFSRNNTFRIMRIGRISYRRKRFYSFCLHSDGEIYRRSRRADHHEPQVLVSFDMQISCTQTLGEIKRWSACVVRVCKSSNSRLHLDSARINGKTITFFNDQLNLIVFFFFYSMRKYSAVRE